MPTVRFYFYRLKEKIEAKRAVALTSSLIMRKCLELLLAVIANLLKFRDINEIPLTRYNIKINPID